MSHMECNIDALITDLDILERTLQEKFPTAKLMRDQKTHAWFGKWVDDFHGDKAAYRHGINPEDYGKCDHAIRVEGSEYEVGLVPIKRDGVEGWCAVWDNWRGHAIVEAFGRGSEKLMTEYARMTAVVTAEQQGMTYQENVLDNGEIEVLLTKY